MTPDIQQTEKIMDHLAQISADLNEINFTLKQLIRILQKWR